MGTSRRRGVKLGRLLAVALFVALAVPGAVASTVTEPQGLWHAAARQRRMQSPEARPDEGPDTPWIMDGPTKPTTAEVSIQPPHSSVSQGDTLTVSVQIDGVVNLGAYAFRLLYDPDVFEVVDVEDGGFLGSTGRSIIILGPDINNVAGIMEFGATSMDTGLSGPDGAGVLGVITLEAVGVGTTDLDLDEVQLLDPGANELAANLLDGSAVSIGNVVHNAIYLPLGIRCWPPVPETPTLSAIDNPGDGGNYTVQWRDAERASSYVLQEAVKATAPTASDFTEIYRGASRSLALSGRGAGRYHYRVMARNSWGESAWSNVASVDVLWEAEPNDDREMEANGPIVSGLTYHGTFPNQAHFDRDYYFFDLSAGHTINAWLTNVPEGQDYDLLLWDADDEQITHSAKSGQADERISTEVLPAGRYYLEVYHWDSGGSAQPYHLRVVYDGASGAENVITNGGFEQGHTGWYTFTLFDLDEIRLSSVD